jgi:hypothetical protein
MTMRPALISAMISGIGLIARDIAGEGVADFSIACKRVGFTMAAKVVTGTLIILRRPAAATDAGSINTASRKAFNPAASPA